MASKFRANGRQTRLFPRAKTVVILYLFLYDSVLKGNMTGALKGCDAF